MLEGMFKFLGLSMGRPAIRELRHRLRLIPAGSIQRNGNPTEKQSDGMAIRIGRPAGRMRGDARPRNHICPHPYRETFDRLDCPANER